MSDRTRHSEWLSLIDVSGPFLAEPVLKDTFPQGLGGLDAAKKTLLRQAYDEWREARDLDDPLLLKIHSAWIDLVLKQGLELDEQGKADVLKPRASLSETLAYELPEHGVTLRPDYAVVDAEGLPRMLIATYAPDIPLTDARKGDAWAAPPAERMVELCRATQVRLGLVTNGEHWMLVDAPVGAATTMANWYARLWGQEPLTLQAFVNLLGIRRFFVDRSEQLPALLDRSLEHQDEVTDALGEQVRRAVEVLIQALERADVDRKRELLEGIEPTELYEAGLTVMMRIVFLLSAEERGLLLMGDPRYEGNYAVSTVRLQLRAESEEILERRWDAWSRLLSVFRAVYGGIDHDSMRLPALGGSLFDPDRYPFLEGRAKGSSWRSDPATPLPIDNRTVLLLLEAVQLFQGRTLSYLALDVEQIGYVYEGLLERTAVRAGEVTLDLDATKNADTPWVTLPELDDAAAKGRKNVEELLQDRTGSSPSRVRNDWGKDVNDASAEKLLTVCQGDGALRDRVKPYFHLLRTDPWGHPLVYPKGTVMVRMGAGRRETGTHYTPKSLTEAIVKEALEPLAYFGPDEGKPRDAWQLKAPKELLGLKICDPAMGSGAFLVQVCRWLSERVVEAWAQAEQQGSAISSEGEVFEAIGSLEPLRSDPEERLLTARRLIAERCLYGVDINPLAVELAKLSIWLVTLSRGRPFGFLDHNLRAGDSLLGITSQDQLYYLDMEPRKGSSKQLFAANLEKGVAESIKVRSELRQRPVRDIRDVNAMADLDQQARHLLRLASLSADAFVGTVLAPYGQTTGVAMVAGLIGEAVAGHTDKVEELQRAAHTTLKLDLPTGKTPRRPFHWPLEFSEVFKGSNSGFDSIVGNPPFLGGKKISGVFGDRYREYLVEHVAGGTRGHADLIAYFFLRVGALVRRGGTFGLIASNSIVEGDTRDVGLTQLLARGGAIYRATRSEIWPGTANVATSRIHFCRGEWGGLRILDNAAVSRISASLTDRENWSPVKLSSNLGACFQGSIILGLGFTLTPLGAKAILQKHPEYAGTVLFPYLIGKEVNSHPIPTPGRWVINFWDWPESKAKTYPDLYEQVLRNVKPERDALKNNVTAQGYKDRWWRFGRDGKNLYHAVGRGGLFVAHPTGAYPRTPLDLVIVFATQATKYPCFTIVKNESIYANSLGVVASQSFGLLAALSSDLHAIWAFEHGSRLEERLRYTHGDIFETFPFPPGVLENRNQSLERVGKKFFDKRQAYLVGKNMGMTKFYNDFHDAEKRDAQIKELRELQVEMNHEVLKAYGFESIDLAHDFREVGYQPSGKNIRFTISEPARIELLYRLAVLNKLRHERESRTPALSARRLSDCVDEIPSDGLFATRAGAGGASG
ncbi:Eco57I restriction-modification methylase domain-containing protein [Bradyrhizobium sp. Ec3.3]|uniref:Eco57I restriction-modification methylase domain-containing protein n=1 Tax=Bradyrhizobium sp. Ec3.3 TaxID=189753 RepID=UPI000416B715|nr:type IIL restriction-modification enzyme MmeI [Bradyrhizobium sp. Ec3.3]